MADDHESQQKSEVLSFGFSRKTEKKNLTKSVLKEEENEKVTETDFVSSLEGKEILSTKPVEEEKPLVIPLITVNKWHHAKTPKELERLEDEKAVITKSVVQTSGDTVTDEAVNELLKEAARHAENWEAHGAANCNIAIPLLMKNKIPDGFEDDDKLDVSLRPDVAADADYDAIPIEQYGMALLRGMGWKDGEGIGKNNASSGYCSHICGLVHTLDLWSAQNKDVPSDLSCTSVPQQWNRPRGRHIRSEPVHNLVIAKAKVNRKRKPVISHLMDCSAIKPVEAVPRPKGLGLGADRSTKMQQKAGGNKDQVADAEIEIELKKGVHCQVVMGKHVGLYGFVQGVDEEASRVIMKLTLSSEVISINVLAAKGVTKKEYDKYSKYLNKAKVDKYTEEEDDKDKYRSNHSSTESEHRHCKYKRKHKHKDSDRDAHKKHSQRHQNYSPQTMEEKSHMLALKNDSPYHHRRDEDESSPPVHGRNRANYTPGNPKTEHDGPPRSFKQDDDGGINDRKANKKHRRHKQEDEQRKDCSRKKQKELHEKSRLIHNTKSSNGSHASPLWLRPHLRVRIVDPAYANGKYFKLKVVVDDVVSMDTCSCKTDDGKYLEGLSQKQLETVIPRSEPAYVMVVSGRNKGQLGEILKKDKCSQQVAVQLISDRDNIIKLDYSNVCEYMGDIHHEMNF